MNQRLALPICLAIASLLGACATPGTEASGFNPPRTAMAPPAASGLAPLVDLQGAAAPERTGTPAAGLLASDESAQAAVAPIDPLSPETPIDPSSAATQTDLWQRLRLGFAMPDLEGPLVLGREQYYAGKPEAMRRMAERGGRYLFHVIEEIERRGMPTELALLPFVESAFNPQAMSTAKASGMWQFVPATGKDYALTQNVFRDDRRDVLASTRAALDYLGRLHTLFGDWHLALAAYNWGEGSVARAIARNQKAGLPTDYASLRMPDETRLYVPKLQAIKNIVARPEQFAVQLPELRNHPYFLSVPIARDIDVDLAAKLAGVTLEEFRQLNPQMNKPVILAAGTEQVLLPYDNANQFASRLQAHKGPMASWTAWVAPSTLRPADAARKVGMSEAQLREVNRIPPRMLVKAGSTLLVPRHAARTEDVSEHLADNAMMALAPDLPPLRKVSLKAGKKGESVASVAKRYRLSAAQVAQWNKTSPGARFAGGSTIVVYLPQSTRKVAANRPAAARPTNAPQAPSRKTPAKPVRVAQR